jgi:hypothetical protein
MDNILYHVNHHISLHGFLNCFTGHHRVFISIRRWISNSYFDSITLCGRLRSRSAILIAHFRDSTDWKKYPLYRHFGAILYSTSPNCSSKQLCRSCKFLLHFRSKRMLTHSTVYPSIPSWIHRFPTPSYRRSFFTRCFPPYQTTLRNGFIRIGSCFRTRSCSCYLRLCGSCKWMEMGFLDHVVVVRVQSGLVGVYHARGESHLPLGRISPPPQLPWGS